MVQAAIDAPPEAAESLQNMVPAVIDHRRDKHGRRSGRHHYERDHRNERRSDRDRGRDRDRDSDRDHDRCRLSSPDADRDHERTRRRRDEDRPGSRMTCRRDRGRDRHRRPQRSDSRSSSWSRCGRRRDHRGNSRLAAAHGCSDSREWATSSPGKADRSRRSRHSRLRRSRSRHLLRSASGSNQGSDRKFVSRLAALPRLRKRYERHPAPLRNWAIGLSDRSVRSVWRTGLGDRSGGRMCCVRLCSLMPERQARPRHSSHGLGVLLVAWQISIPC